MSDSEMVRLGRLVSVLVLFTLLLGDRVLVSSLLDEDEDGGFSVAISGRFFFSFRFFRARR